MSEPDVIGPDLHPKKNVSYYIKNARRAFFTKEGLVGDYDYGYLFKPNLPFMGRKNVTPPFFGLDDKMPTLLAALLGLQHTLAMLAGVITPSIILSGAGGVNLPVEIQQYLVSTSLIVCGILSAIQITRFHIWKTPYVFHKVVTADDLDIILEPVLSLSLELLLPLFLSQVELSPRCTPMDTAQLMQTVTLVHAHRPMVP
jgi:Permease family